LIFWTECWADQVVVAILSAAKPLPTAAKQILAVVAKTPLPIVDAMLHLAVVANLIAILAAASL